MFLRSTVSLESVMAGPDLISCAHRSHCLSGRLARLCQLLWLGCSQVDTLHLHRDPTPDHVPAPVQPLPLRGFDEEVRQFVAEQYELHGLNLHPEATPTEIQKGADGKLTLISESKKHGKVVLEGLDHVLLATGRKPNTKNLGCEEVCAAI